MKKLQSGSGPSFIVRLAISFSLSATCLGHLASAAAQQVSASEAAQQAILSAGVTLVSNIQYASHAGVAPERQSLDVYARPGISRAPVVLFVHRGSWQTGDKRAVGLKPIPFAAAGYVTVATNYRFRPDASISEMAADIAAAVAWIRANIERFGGDPDRIALMGHSAGAHLVAVVGANTDFLNAAGVPPDSIIGVVPLDTGPYDVKLQLQTSGRESSYGKMLHMVFGEDPEVWKHVSPADNIGPKTPPFLVVSSDNRGDSESQAHRLVNLLNAAGVKAEWFMAKGLNHNGVNTAIGPAYNDLTRKVVGFLADVAQP